MKNLEKLLRDLIWFFKRLSSRTVLPNKVYFITESFSFDKDENNDEYAYCIIFLEDCAISELEIEGSENLNNLTSVSEGIELYGKINKLEVSSGSAFIYSTKN